MILFLISTLRILCDCDRDCSGIYGGLFMLVMMYGWTLIDIKKKKKLDIFNEKETNPQLQIYGL